MGGGDEYPPPPYDEATFVPPSTSTSDTQPTAGPHKKGPLGKILDFFEPKAESSTLSTTPAATEVASDLRKRYIDTGSKRLTGQFSLYDLLSIRSQSGSIDVSIHPQAADKKNPIPAELLIDSQSGSVNVRLESFDVPEREYAVAIDSQSGSVSGTLIHGRRTSVVSRSGRISLQLTLSGASKHASSLNTRSESGRTDITVHHLAGHFAASGGGPAIKQMSSTHSTASGSLVLRYPRDWEGVIEGQTQSGGLRLHGAGIEVISQGPTGVCAKKGDGESRLSFSTASGGVDVYFD